jgi:regulator of protease activity HflC (stomatin/prohibitin superfamily)
MRKYHIFAYIVLGLAAMFTPGCSCFIGPPKVEICEEIANNETAFVIPLEGANKTEQGKFGSVEYLEEKKVATKRITLPQREKITGRWWGDYVWVPTVKIIKVDRSPITREWTQSAQKGTSTNDDAIDVESKDSIGFSVGINITCSVLEEDAAKFLYHYPGGSLKLVVDTNVRGFCASVLSREFGSRDLTKCKSDKREISSLLLEEVQKEFKVRGITINSLGIVGGLIYDSKEIQKAIDDGYVAEQRIKIAEQQKLEQDKINEKNISIAKAEADAANEFKKAAEARIEMVRLEIEKIRAEALKMWVSKWDGTMPANIMPQGSQFLMGMDMPDTPKKSTVPKK